MVRNSRSRRGLVAFVVYQLASTAVRPDRAHLIEQVAATACWLGLLLVALALHELAHAFTAYLLDCDQEEVHIWPLGSLVGPSYVPRSSEHVLVALAGPLVSGAVFLGAAIGVNVIVGAQFAWNPFGFDKDAGAPLRNGLPVPALTPIWFLGWFGYLNYVLMLVNVFIPALPFDCGRMLRAYLASTSVVSTRESIAAPWTAHTCAVMLGIIGVVRLALFRQFDGLTVIGLAVLVEVLARGEARDARRRRLFQERRLRLRFLRGIHQSRPVPGAALPGERAETLAPAPVGPAAAATDDP